MKVFALIIAIYCLFRLITKPSNVHLNREAARRRQQLIDEKGYDPYSIDSVMKARGIKYDPKPASTPDHPSNADLSLWKRYLNWCATTWQDLPIPPRQSRRTSSPTFYFNYDDHREGNHYRYWGENDSVHRPHHYETDHNGRRYRVYDDYYDDRDD